MLECVGALAALLVLANFKLFYAWWWRETLIKEYLALQLRIERARANQSMNPLAKLQAAEADTLLQRFSQTVQEGTASATRLYLDTFDPVVYAVLSVVGNLVALSGQDAAFEFSWDIGFGGCLVWGVVLVCLLDLLFTHLLGRKIPAIKQAALDSESALRALVEGGHTAAPTLDAYALRTREAVDALGSVNARLRWHQVLVSLWQGPYQALFIVVPWIVVGLYANHCSTVATVGMVSQAAGTIVIIKDGVCTFSANWSTSISDLFAHRQRLKELLVVLRQLVAKTEDMERETQNVIPLFRRPA